MKKLIFLAIFALMGIPGTAAAAERRTEIGLLECTVEGGFGFIFGSRKNIRCEFDPADGVVGTREVYHGVIRKFGLDIGMTRRSYLAWLVLAPTVADYSPGALAGDYIGVSGEATIGVGVGGNLLIGGSSDTFSLQPLSVTAQTGLNFAVGVASLELNN
ncbi:MAG: DUF992 domain-containing protein [Cucumibacter sp.]